MKTFEIWMEGYRATGESSGASKIGEAQGADFDDAVRNYMEACPNSGIEEYPPDTGTFLHPSNRRSNWNIWACALFDNEAEARKSFG